MTRIRYKLIEGMWITNEMIGGSDLLEVYIVPGNTRGNYKHCALFYKNNGMNSFHSIEHKNLTTIKKLVKNQLKTFGVVFQDEVRPRLRS